MCWGQGDWTHEAVSTPLNAPAQGTVGLVGTGNLREGVLEGEGWFKMKGSGEGWPCLGEKPQREPIPYLSHSVFHHRSPFDFLTVEQSLTCSHLFRLRFFFFSSYVGWRIQRDNCFDHFCFLNLTVFLLQIVWNYLFPHNVCHSKFLFSRQIMHLSWGFWGYFPAS